MNPLDQAILSVIASLAPDHMAPVTVDSYLVDDLGYDSPRKMELVAALESRLQMRLKDPEIPLETVGEVIGWVNRHVGETA
ncbi:MULTISPECIES: acyl carrier protein [Mycobacterium ulcerans group]|uniref:Acyl carrier protein n=3 Tax=Mycobacterium ulcerans group TaxID=2993898 RepID=B2HHX3_MYCMM|nr:MULTISPECIES: acyl carrier protein [Mycobacterium ulcerans group]ACC43373.1 acyl carrier protein [Mycobacterium marinum M]AXN46892.1 Acyl carrier protein [Mycobacterium marinum]AXN52321.1 Acyl carrier protein [Mycobacterium marinum]EPQ71647.1 hypothetical protein MMEU_3029 [Mycobacterium marinum str. Europe]EPQ78652.1 hypothetical protein MMMB2_3314 [Mycobacterium marinum MB2]